MAHACVGQPRRAAIPSLVLYTVGVPGTFHSICNTRGVCQDGARRPPSTASRLETRRHSRLPGRVCHSRDLMLGGDRVVALLLPGQRDTVRSETPYRGNR